ncbi:6998_t:CDS:2, partial [Entrophospora sp. SA101]
KNSIWKDYENTIMTYYNSCVYAASGRKLDGNKITVSDDELEKVQIADKYNINQISEQRIKQNQKNVISIAERNQERGKKIQEQKRNLETFDWDKEKIKAKEFEPTFAKYIFDFEKIIKCLACDAFPKYSPTGLCQYHDFCLKFGYHHEFPNNQYTPPSQDLKANPPTSYDVLTKVFKYQKFQESQEMAISEYVNGNHTFVSMRTGTCKEIDAHAILENLCISPSDVTFVQGISFSCPELKIEVHSKSTKEKLIREIIMLLKELEDGKCIIYCPTVHVCDNVYELLCEKADLDMIWQVTEEVDEAKPVSKVNLMSDVLKMVEVSEEVVNKLNENGKIATPKNIIQVYCQLKCDHEELTLLNTYKDKTFKQERLIKTKAEALHLLDLLIIRKIVKVMINLYRPNSNGSILQTNLHIFGVVEEKLGYNTALLNKIPNKSERISAHLKKCSNFKIMHPEKYNEFFGSDETINLNSRDLEQISSSNSSISTKGSLDSFVVHPIC